MMYSRNRRKGESVTDYHARRIREADARMPLPILAMMYDGNPPEYVRALLAANHAPTSAASGRNQTGKPGEE